LTLISKSLPQVFKGIALFTPGGDLVYCIDPNKQTRWHVHLCGMFQQLLGLSEPPHFLVPCYSATVDCVLNPHTDRVEIIAEGSPLILRYQSLLNAVFETAGAVWKFAPLQHEVCDPVILAAYRTQFPQLWQNHNLVARYEQAIAQALTESQLSSTENTLLFPENAQNYVLRLFVSGSSSATERTLQKLHHLLEAVLGKIPYSLSIIDVSQRPEEAELNLVSATPTLVRIHPRPMYRIVGNLENTNQLLGVLKRG
jgi:circadian clock protein KaiB